MGGKEGLWIFDDFPTVALLFEDDAVVREEKILVEVVGLDSGDVVAVDGFALSNKKVVFAGVTFVDEFNWIAGVASSVRGEIRIVVAREKDFISGEVVVFGVGFEFGDGGVEIDVFGFDTNNGVGVVFFVIVAE